MNTNRPFSEFANYLFNNEKLKSMKDVARTELEERRIEHELKYRTKLLTLIPHENKDMWLITENEFIGYVLELRSKGYDPQAIVALPNFDYKVQNIYIKEKLPYPILSIESPIYTYVDIKDFKAEQDYYVNKKLIKEVLGHE